MRRHRRRRSSGSKGWKKVHGRWVKTSSHRDASRSKHRKGHKKGGHKKHHSKSRHHGSVHVRGYHVAGYTRKPARRRRRK